MGVLGHMGGYEEKYNPFLECEGYTSETPQEYCMKRRSIDQQVKQLFSERVGLILEKYSSFNEIEKILELLLNSEGNESEFEQVKSFCVSVGNLGFGEICKALNHLGEKGMVPEEKILEVQVLIFFGLGNSINYLLFSEVLKKYLVLVPKGLEKIASLLEVSERDLLDLLHHQLENHTVYEGKDTNFIMNRDQNTIMDQGLSVHIFGSRELTRQLKSTTPDMDVLRRIVNILWEYNYLHVFEKTYNLDTECFSKMVEQYNFEDQRSTKEKSIFYTTLGKLSSDFLRHITLLEDFQRNYLRLYLSSLRTQKSDSLIDVENPL